MTRWEEQLEKDDPKEAGTYFEKLGTMEFVLEPKRSERDVCVDLCFQKKTAKIGRYIGHEPEIREHEDQRVPVPQVIKEGRGLKLSLKRNGFELVEQCFPKLETVTNQTLPTYHGQVTDLVKKMYEKTGRRVREVFVFDTTLRDSSVTGSLNPSTEFAAAAPVNRVHCDYTKESGPRRLQQLRPEVTATNFAFANVWRSLDTTNPVQAWPLAFLDPNGLDLDDPDRCFLYNLVYKDRVGLNYSLGTDTSNYEWYYFSQITHSDALIFSVFDSDPSKPGFVFHTAFDLPPAYHQPYLGAPPPDDFIPPPHRSSIEVRVVAIFDD